MFNIHSTELLLVCIVALLVIGPERLPAAIRTVTLWTGRIRRSFYKVKAEIEQEIDADGIRRQLHNEAVLDDIKSIKATTATAKDMTDDIKADLQKTVASAQDKPKASMTTEDKS